MLNKRAQNLFIFLPRTLLGRLTAAIQVRNASNRSDTSKTNSRLHLYDHLYHQMKLILLFTWILVKLVGRRVPSLTKIVQQCAPQVHYRPTPAHELSFAITTDHLITAPSTRQRQAVAVRLSLQLPRNLSFPGIAIS